MVFFLLFFTRYGGAHSISSSVTTHTRTCSCATEIQTDTVERWQPGDIRGHVGSVINKVKQMVCLEPDCGKWPREGRAGTEVETEGGQEEVGGVGETKKEGGATCPQRVQRGRRHPLEFNWPLRAAHPINAAVALLVRPGRGRRSVLS